ncbi:hypothetical protein HK100_007105 [Physocladia obscura]|uniref:Uncharacterized protein n=1 Tax=Physocladia obscura TaxID=109957 RepID=A0AAD5XBB9_9FUNG|nr:hypothetical protein HK100_007105 [Physocladia obscura]
MTPVSTASMKKINLSEYSSKVKLSSVTAVAAVAVKSGTAAAAAVASPVNGGETEVAVKLESLGNNANSASSVNGRNGGSTTTTTTTTKLNWKNFVAIHKHKGDEINQKIKSNGGNGSGAVVSEGETQLMSGKDDGQIAKTHMHESALLQFVLKRLSKVKMNEIYSLMLRLESILLTRFARRKLHESCKRAKSVSAHMSEKTKDNNAGGTYTLHCDSQNMVNLKDVLQTTLEVDQMMYKAESQWNTAEKKCLNYHEAFPQAGQNGQFQITSYCEYKDLSEYGVRCLREYAERNGINGF